MMIFIMTAYSWESNENLTIEHGIGGEKKENKKKKQRNQTDERNEMSNVCINHIKLRHLCWANYVKVAWIIVCVWQNNACLMKGYVSIEYVFRNVSMQVLTVMNNLAISVIQPKNHIAVQLIDYL